MGWRLPHRYVFISLLGVLMIGCTSDSGKELGEGYVLVLEGKGVDHIYNEDPQWGGVPYGVIQYAYDDKFIIALQQPRKFDDVIDPRELDYKHGRDTTYFWVISKVDHTLFGPLDKRELEERREQLGIPRDFGPLQDLY
jgi:hypothetical protein